MSFALLLPYIIPAAGVVLGWLIRHKGIGPGIPTTPAPGPVVPAPGGAPVVLPAGHPLIDGLRSLFDGFVQAVAGVLQGVAVTPAPVTVPALTGPAQTGGPDILGVILSLLQRVQAAEAAAQIPAPVVQPAPAKAS